MNASFPAALGTEPLPTSPDYRDFWDTALDEARRHRGGFTDVARGIEATRSLDEVDPARVAAIGNSQGGGVALGAGALVPDLVAVLAQAPFLTDAPEALRGATAPPGPSFASTSPSIRAASMPSLAPSPTSTGSPPPDTPRPRDGSPPA